MRQWTVEQLWRKASREGWSYQEYCKAYRELLRRTPKERKKLLAP